jgi:F-type H+-transporting ATPase subunit delta
MVEGSIARRYARALLELGRDENQIDRLGADLERFQRVLDAGPPEVANVMSNPVFTNSERRAVLDRLLPGLGLQSHTASFLRLLLDKDRFGALPDIVREYRALADTEAGRVRATVTTATELPGDTRSAVASALAQATGKQVVLDTRVDPALLGGLVAQVGGRVYDASLRTRLERLQLNLVNPSQA